MTTPMSYGSALNEYDPDWRHDEEKHSLRIELYGRHLRGELLDLPLVLCLLILRIWPNWFDANNQGAVAVILLGFVPAGSEHPWEQRARQIFKRVVMVPYMNFAMASLNNQPVIFRGDRSIMGAGHLDSINLVSRLVKNQSVVFLIPQYWLYLIVAGVGLKGEEAQRNNLVEKLLVQPFFQVSEMPLSRVGLDGV